MAKTYALDRVAADLARGFTHPAIQRLGSLVAAHPHDLDLRRRLATVHRRVGNRVQAGRWDYLTIGADARDTAAFERAFPSAAARLREVSWPHRASAAATAYARRRLAALMAAAAAEQSTGGAAPRRARAGGGATGWARAAVGRAHRLVRPRRSGRSWDAATTLLAVVALATAPFVVIGFVTVIQWAVS
jgi:hypothetical protein